MGVEYRHLLIARPNSFRPSPVQAATLVDALRRGGWIGTGNRGDTTYDEANPYLVAKRRGFFLHDGGGQPRPIDAGLETYLAEHPAEDILLGWPIEWLQTGEFQHPLEPIDRPVDYDEGELSAELQLHFGHNFIYQTSEGIHPFDPAPACTCGQLLEYDPMLLTQHDPFYAGRIAQYCPGCGRAFDPAALVCDGCDGWTGDPIHILGGAAYRFAIVVVCGKSFPQTPMRVKQGFRDLFESALGIQAYEVTDFS